MRKRLRWHRNLALSRGAENQTDPLPDRLRGLVRQVVNLRRIVNPPAALGRAATAFGESARAVGGLHAPIQTVLPINRAAIRSPVAPAAAPQLYR